MNIIKKLSVSLIIVIISACTSIPEKVPKLIEVSANTVDTQSALVVAEWEASIAAVNSSKKMLGIIHSYISSLDKSKLTIPDKAVVAKFIKGYPHVIKQLDNVLLHKQEPQKTLARFEKITNAIRLANSYVAKSVGENSRLEAVIESLSSLKTEQTEGDNK